MTLRHLAPLSLVLILPALSATSLADERPSDVQVWTIRATTKHEKISPELRSLAARLKQQFKYTGFTLEKRADGRVALGKPYELPLPEDYRAAVTPESRNDGKIKLKIVVRKKQNGKTRELLTTTVTLKAGAFVPIGCGPLAGGDYLVIAVRAR